jgi:hypothetical protein
MDVVDQEFNAARSWMRTDLVLKQNIGGFSIADQTQLIARTPLFRDTPGALLCDFEAL